MRKGEQRRAITGALDSAREELPRDTGDGETFGWESPEDENDFLSSVDKFLMELSVQLTARQATGAVTFDEQRSLINALAIDKDGLNPDCKCEHARAAHQIRV